METPISNSSMFSQSLHHDIFHRKNGTTNWIVKKMVSFLREHRNWKPWFFQWNSAFRFQFSLENQSIDIWIILITSGVFHHEKAETLNKNHGNDHLPSKIAIEISRNILVDWFSYAFPMVFLWFAIEIIELQPTFQGSPWFSHGKFPTARRCRRCASVPLATLSTAAR